MRTLRDVQLELSLKPFRSAREEDVEALTRSLVGKWHSLITHAEQLSILLWVGDGTELLEYDGHQDRRFPWAIYIGRGSDRHKVPEDLDPNHESLDGYAKPYVAHPNEYTYGDLQRIVRVMKATAERETKLKVRIGTILEPGGEFLKSNWKYERHPECLFSGDAHMGYNIDCTSVLHADATPYAGFPGGIPEGTPWGTFFGRQANRFIKDMGFDYLWMSNGYGTARSPYAYGWCGQFFDGKTFKPEGNREVKAKILRFWELFREACPDVPVRLRGTDFVTGMDLVNHATPYRELLDGRFGTTQPPNTPWPALTGNFGMALAAFMGRMSVAEGTVPYRMYTSDPWWANSAWVDSFNRSPHDIYLNLALAAIQPDGKVKGADRIDFLTVDTSWGEVPEWIPDEVIGHVKAGFRWAPDEAGPLVWVYPFDEYEQMTYAGAAPMAQVFAGDLFFQEAINNLLPVNTVVSSRTFLQQQKAGGGFYRDRVLLSPVPPAGSPLEAALLGHVHGGGRVLIYGSLTHAGPALLSALGIRHAPSIDGKFTIKGLASPDRQPRATDAARLCHQPAISGGGLTEVDSGGATGVLHTLTAQRRGQERVIARVCEVGEGGGAGRLAWVRGTSSVDLGVEVDRGVMNLRSMKPLAASKYFRSEKLMRHLLSFLGYELTVERERPKECARHLAVSRHRNGFRFTLFSEERGMKVRMRFPLGAPILEGEPVELREGASCYRFHRFLHAECRVFVRANEGALLECNIVQSLHHRFRHRINLIGLKNATVCFFPPDGDPGKAQVLLNPDLRILSVGQPFESRWVRDGFGGYWEIGNVSGILSFAW